MSYYIISDVEDIELDACSGRTVGRSRSLHKRILFSRNSLTRVLGLALGFSATLANGDRPIGRRLTVGGVGVTGDTVASISGAEDCIIWRGEGVGVNAARGLELKDEDGDTWVGKVSCDCSKGKSNLTTGSIESVVVSD